MTLTIPKATVTQLIITGLISLMFGGFVGATSFYHIRSFDQAFFKYEHNRTSENEAALNLEREKLQHMRNVDSLKAALLFFFLSNCVYSLLRRKARLATLSLLFACSTFLAYVGLPSMPIDRRCCAYWGLGFDEGVSESAVQIFGISVWLISATLFLLSLVIHHRRGLRLINGSK